LREIGSAEAKLGKASCCRGEPQKLAPAAPTHRVGETFEAALDKRRRDVIWLLNLDSMRANRVVRQANRGRPSHAATHHSPQKSANCYIAIGIMV
jgi:hypothetical protein